ncbi:hypothetical protein PENPOL_c007G01405 [Penicillium polonicum]|uniref:Uncharacterized protein n=1 Tax=Penicillium polonicum TaxID=60169 RepID=A0A1V6NIQ2_PENPO|nr:hypothetical protein PENPOL_c007G01405 [Penicillium polonicum]
MRPSMGLHLGLGMMLTCREQGHLEVVELVLENRSADLLLNTTVLTIIVEFGLLEQGALNNSFQVQYGNTSTVIRFPQPGATMFPEEKFRDEVAIMRYIRDQTSIPIRFIFHPGTKMIL